MTHSIRVDFGNGIVAGTGAPVRIMDHEGITSLPAQANVVDNAMLDGGYIASFRAGVRRLTFDLDFLETDLGWAEVPRLFPMGVRLDLTIERDGLRRVVGAYRDSELVALGNRGTEDSVAYQVSLVSIDPYMLGDEVELSAAGAVSGGLEYPTAFQPSIAWDNLAYIDHIAVRNDGDYPVGFTFDLVAAAEIAAMTLSVGRDTMTFKTIHAGQRLTADTARQTIRIDGTTNGFAWLDSGSFLKIPIGESSIWFGAFSGSATVEFTPIYEGV